MKTYNVHITQILGCDVLVEADSEEEAKDIISNNIYKDYIQDSLNYGDDRVEVLEEVDVSKYAQYFAVDKEGNMQRRMQELKITSNN